MILLRLNRGSTQDIDEFCLIVGIGNGINQIKNRVLPLHCLVSLSGVS